MAKQSNKIPKYKSGNILKHINPISKSESVVKLLRRYDNQKTHDVSWWVTDPTNSGNEVGVPERELFPID